MRGLDRIDQRGMKLGAVLAHLQHVAQDRQLAARRMGQKRQSRCHGSGIGVVAFVDHLDARCLEPRAAPFESREILQHRRRVQHVAFGQRHRRQRRDRVHGDMGALRTDQAIYRAAHDVGLEPHALA